ncbi:hypothetical protein NKL05_33685 [Mesorhizobium sp. C420B]|uniref:hypothetical protein n=1 Tax=unclassified Mesorhizobium TaxID=325217 RepID=UPI0012EB423F|nr:hypothetical protein [Mesorhizobium sp. LSHC420B00]
MILIHEKLNRISDLNTCSGFTGDTSAATLYSRYPQYVTNLKKELGRPAVSFMSDLFFNYVLLAGSTVDLGKMEKSLLSGVIPPVNKRNIEATITAAKAAARACNYGVVHTLVTTLAQGRAARCCCPWSPSC